MTDYHDDYRRARFAGFAAGGAARFAFSFSLAFARRTAYFRGPGALWGFAASSAGL